MAFLALLLAMVLEVLLPEPVFARQRAWLARMSAEFEVNLAALGAPAWAAWQWWVPVLVWLFVVWLIHTAMHAWLLGLAPLLGGLLSVYVLLLGLRFKSLAQILTNTQLFLNQGDVQRAQAHMAAWLQPEQGAQLGAEYGTEHSDSPATPPADQAEHVVNVLMEEGVRRALREYFALLLWFVVLPGATGVVVYLAVRWSVTREREAAAAQATGLPSLLHLWAQLGWRCFLSPRGMQYLLDWLPTRLLVLTVALVSQFDDVLLAWRVARVQHPLSNTHVLKAACSAAIGLPVQGRPGHWGRVEYLQAFRTLMQKCALAWLVLVAMLAVLSAVPRLAA